MGCRGRGLTDRGLVRPGNEDAFLIDDELGVYVVSDGMGGHAAGEVASQLTVSAAHRAVEEHASSIRDASTVDETRLLLKKAANEAVQAACSAVYERAQREPQLAGMGCTLTMLFVSGRTAVMAHVGDSRLYVIRDGDAEQLSTDHTMAEDLVRLGDLSREGARTSRFSHCLTRCIGIQPSVTPEFLLLDLQVDDHFLLCSDGLSQYLHRTGELGALLDGDDPDEILQGLIQHANQAGGRDNITALLIEVVSVDDNPTAEFDLDAWDHAEILNGVECFRHLRFPNRVRLLHHLRHERCSSGQTWLTRGATCPGMCIVASGSLLIHHESGKVRLEAGQAFGAEALFGERVVLADVTAEGDSSVLVFSRDGLQAWARQVPRSAVTTLLDLGPQLVRDPLRTSANVAGD